MARGFPSTLALGFVLTSFVAGCARDVDRQLLDAAAEGNVPQVVASLEAGARIEARANDDWTALTVAAREGHGEVVVLLLKRRAAVNAPEGGGHTALFWAERAKHDQVVRLLREGGGVNR